MSTCCCAASAASSASYSSRESRGLLHGFDLEFRWPTRLQKLHLCFFLRFARF